MRRILRTVMRSWRDERGMVLPLTLMALLVLGTLSAVLLTVGSSEVQIAANLLASTRVHFLAEAGLEDSFNSFRTTPTLLSTAPATLTAAPGLSGPGQTLQASGSYTVQYQAAGTNTVLVVATGTAGSSQKVLRATLSTQFTPNDAFRTNGDLTISGNPTLSGTCGRAHTNNNLTISGSPSFTERATASGTYTGDPALGQGGQAKKPVPAVNPASFLTAAQQTLPANQIYQMKSDGKVLDGNSNEIPGAQATLLSGGEFNGWKYNPGTPTKWDYSGNTAYDGTYYIEGEAKVSGNAGNNVTPWKTTIIATGDIETSGTPTVSSHLKDTFLVAGLDIKIHSDFVQKTSGIVAAHEQIEISGKPTIKGYIVAENATATSNTVTNVKLSGDLTITFDCGLTPPLQGPLQILTWGP